MRTRKGRSGFRTKRPRKGAKSHLKRGIRVLAILGAKMAGERKFSLFCLYAWCLSYLNIHIPLKEHCPAKIYLVIYLCSFNWTPAWFPELEQDPWHCISCLSCLSYLGSGQFSTASACRKRRLNGSKSSHLYQNINCSHSHWPVCFTLFSQNYIPCVFSGAI